MTVLPASTSVLSDALDLYESRPDKAWSLTDCTSFVVMKHESLTDVLTGDSHFQQAGFAVLLD